MYDFSGITVLVTGGSDGIGFAISKAFSERGARLVIVGRKREKLEQVKEVLGATTEVIAVDLARLDAAEQIGDVLKDKGIFPSVLVNNAGIARFAPLEDTGPELFDAHLNTNLRTPFLLSRELLPALQKQRGTIINISSYFARRMLIDRPSAAYSASKGAIESLTKALAFELGPYGIRVNAIAPGTVNTSMVRENISRLSPEGQARFEEMIPQLYPLKRLGNPEDLCGAVLFFASEAASWITGSVLSVDGGLTTH